MRNFSRYTIAATCACGFLGIGLFTPEIASATPTDLGGFTLTSGSVSGSSAGTTFGLSGASFNVTDAANQTNVFQSNSTISSAGNFDLAFNYNISANTAQSNTTGAKTEFSLAGQNGTLNFVINPSTNAITDPPVYNSIPSGGGTGGGSGGGGSTSGLPAGNSGSSGGYYTFTNSYFYMGSVAGINLSYDSSKDILTETISFTGSSPVVFNYNLDLAAKVGSQMNLDFTAVTGTASQTQTISGINYTNTSAVPEPTTLGILAVGCLTLLPMRRRWLGIRD